MEVDLTAVTNEEIDYWCKEFPDLDRHEVIEILSIMDAEGTKEEFWKENPTLEEADVNRLLAKCLAAGYEYHVYNTLNNEAP